MVTWSHVLEVFQKSEILKNAVSGRWWIDSRHLLRNSDIYYLR